MKDKTIEERLFYLEKNIQTISKAQEKFYPKFDEIMRVLKQLVKAFNDLNKSASNMGSMASIFGSVYEENKDTINLIANQLSETMKATPKEKKEEILTQ